MSQVLQGEVSIEAEPISHDQRCSPFSVGGSVLKNRGKETSVLCKSKSPQMPHQLRERNKSSKFKQNFGPFGNGNRKMSQSGRI
jgi:hypothetical protein